MAIILPNSAKNALDSTFDKLFRQYLPEHFLGQNFSFFDQINAQTTQALIGPTVEALGSANGIIMAGTSTGVTPTFTATGSDTNVGISLIGQSGRFFDLGY